MIEPFSHLQGTAYTTITHRWYCNARSRERQPHFVFWGILNSNSAAPFKVPSVSDGSFQNVPTIGYDLMTAPQWRWQLSSIDRRIIGSLDKNMGELPSVLRRIRGTWEKRLLSRRSPLTLKLCVHMAYRTLAEQVFPLRLAFLDSPVKNGSVSLSKDLIFRCPIPRVGSQGDGDI